MHLLVPRDLAQPREEHVLFDIFPALLPIGQLLRPKKRQRLNVQLTCKHVNFNTWLWQYYAGSSLFMNAKGRRFQVRTNLGTI